MNIRQKKSFRQYSMIFFNFRIFFPLDEEKGSASKSPLLVQTVRNFQLVESMTIEIWKTVRFNESVDFEQSKSMDFVYGEH